MYDAEVCCSVLNAILDVKIIAMLNTLNYCLTDFREKLMVHCMRIEGLDLVFFWFLIF